MEPGMALRTFLSFFLRLMYQRLHARAVFFAFLPFYGKQASKQTYTTHGRSSVREKEHSTHGTAWHGMGRFSWAGGKPQGYFFVLCLPYRTYLANSQSSQLLE